MGGSDGWVGWWLDGVDGEVVCAMEAWVVVDECVGMMACS